MKKRKVYVVGTYTEYASWLQDFEVCPFLSECDLVMFTGGEDVNPALYGEPRGPFTYFNATRDKQEMSAFQRASAYKKPMIGICRGAQFLTVMSGGRLIQHQHNPGTHPIITWDGLEIPVSSLHHQAMYPYNLPDDRYRLIAWAENHSPFHLDGEHKEISDKPFKEAEIVYYPATRCLGIQGHPEMMPRSRYKETFQFLDELVEKLITETI